jgi:hypothetical protein
MAFWTANRRAWVPRFIAGYFLFGLFWAAAMFYAGYADSKRYGLRFETRRELGQAFMVTVAWPYMLTRPGR